MAIRDKMQQRAAPHLEAGETIQAVFSAQTTSQWWVLLAGVIFLIKNNYRVVVVTDQRIMVNDSGKLAATNSRAVLHELPRSTVIGPPSGLWYTTEVLGETLYIHKRFHRDIEAADAAIS